MSRLVVDHRNGTFLFIVSTLLALFSLGPAPLWAEEPAGSDPSLSELYDTFLDDEPGAVDFQLSDVDGGTLQLSGLRGQVVVLHFWATWCAPCKRELPSLRAFYEDRYPDLESSGMTLLTVNNDVRRRDLLDFLEAEPQPFPVFFDSLSELNDSLQIVGLPGTVVLDRKGAVLERIHGEQDWQDPAWHARLERALRPAP